MIHKVTSLKSSNSHEKAVLQTFCLKKKKRKKRVKKIQKSKKTILKEYIFIFLISNTKVADKLRP